MASPYADIVGRSNLTPQKVERTGIAFEDLLYQYQNHIGKEQEKNFRIYERSIEVHRRQRALTIDDQCGRFGTRRDSRGVWCSYDTEQDGDIYPLNIVAPAINANQNACLQSDSKIEVVSVNQNARNKQIADRWQKFANYNERMTFVKDERSLIFNGVQTDGTWLIDTYKIKKSAQNIAELRERKRALAVYKCDGCNMQGMYPLDEEVMDGMSDKPCPHCQQPVPTMTKTMSGYDLGESEVPTYDIAHDLVPLFNFTIDVYGAKLKGIPGAKWLQIQTLVDRIELETNYPNQTLSGAMQWSYPLKCDFALAHGAWSYLNQSYTRGDYTEFDKFEKKQVYLHQDAYSNYRFPKDYEFINAFGEKTFEAKAKDTIAEAQERLYGHNPEGFKFVWVDQRLVDIVSPDDEQINFRKRFSDVHWRRDSGAYLSSPHYSLVTIQDALTLLNTMNVNIAARNAVIPVYYDSQVFSPDDFSKEFIGTENAHLLPNSDISKAVTTLPIPAPSPYLQKQIEFYWSIKDDVSNVTPALRGEAQRGETLGAVKQQLEQSYGGLTSTLQSFAQCKVNQFKQAADVAKECFTVEQFQRIASMFGEHWNESDVAEMTEIDFEEELIVSYKNGSEMPQSNLDKEMKFAQGINSLLPLLQMGVPVAPDVFAKILEKIDELAGFDFDLSGLEVSDMLAQKRYSSLVEACKDEDKVSYGEIEASKQEVVAVDQDGTPITAFDIVAEQIFAKAQIRFLEQENLAPQMSFFVEQSQIEMGKAKPNYLLLELLQTMVGLIDQRGKEQEMEAAASDPEAQAMKAEQERLAAEAEQARLDKEAETQSKADGEDAKRTHELVKQAVDQEHDIEKTKLQGAIAMKTAKESARVKQSATPKKK